MKSWPSAIFASALVIAAAIIFAALSPAESQSRGAGFMVAQGGGSYVWRVNTMTGGVSYCVRKFDSVDEGFLRENPPICSGFSPPVGGPP